jgi:hypothetical protein
MRLYDEHSVENQWENDILALTLSVFAVNIRPVPLATSVVLLDLLENK